MLWVKEVEVVESVDDLKSSRSIKGTPGPDFELLDARLASALEDRKAKKSTVSFAEDRSLTWSTNTSGSPVPMILSRIMQTYLLLFFRNDDIQEFDAKCDGILLSMMKIPSDDILEGLHKLRIRESEKHKIVLGMYNMEIFIRRKQDLIITYWKQW